MLLSQVSRHPANHPDCLQARLQPRLQVFRSPCPSDDPQSRSMTQACPPTIACTQGWWTATRALHTRSPAIPAQPAPPPPPPYSLSAMTNSSAGPFRVERLRCCGSNGRVGSTPAVAQRHGEAGTRNQRGRSMVAVGIRSRRFPAPRDVRRSADRLSRDDADRQARDAHKTSGIVDDPDLPQLCRSSKVQRSYSPMHPSLANAADVIGIDLNSDRYRCAVVDTAMRSGAA